MVVLTFPAFSLTIVSQVQLIKNNYPQSIFIYEFSKSFYYRY